MAKTEKTEKYVVIKKHTLGHEIDSVISLTEEKAKSLVGKVRLQSEAVDESKLAEAAGKAQERVNELESEVANLKNEVGRLTSELTQAKKKAK